MPDSMLVITHDNQLISAIQEIFTDFQGTVQFEDTIMRALLVLLEEKCAIAAADLEIGLSSVVSVLEVLKKMSMRIPFILIYSEENEHNLAHLCEKGILYRFRKPMDNDSLQQLKQISDNLFSQPKIELPGKTETVKI